MLIKYKLVQDNKNCNFVVLRPNNCSLIYEPKYLSGWLQLSCFIVEFYYCYGKFIDKLLCCTLMNTENCSIK